MNALSQQIHKLQMLLRMAEITKLEEHIKCTRRSDSVKDEKMGNICMYVLYTHIRKCKEVYMKEITVVFCVCVCVFWSESERQRQRQSDRNRERGVR
jgi:hypothetical protein